jgi:hypothetical protein
MAELNVQPKKKSILPWVLVGLIVLALIAFFLLRNTDLVEDVTDETIFNDSVERATTDTVSRGMDTATRITDTTALR